jgi:hypothetical protein
MRKKTTSAAKKAAPAPKEESARKSGRTANLAAEPAKPLAKKNATLSKAATTVAAVALAAGDLLAKGKKVAKAKVAATRKRKTAPKLSSSRSYTADDIALRAYFISERRRADGLAGGPEEDWAEAERQLQAEHSASIS